MFRTKTLGDYCPIFHMYKRDPSRYNEHKVETISNKIQTYVEGYQWIIANAPKRSFNM